MPILKNKRVVIPLAVVAVIIIFAVVFIIVKNNAYEFYKAGINSYENQEAKMSLVYFKQVTKYPKLIGTFISDAALKQPELQNIVDATEFRENGEFQEAFDLYTSCIEDYPDSPFTEQNQQALYDITPDWAIASTRSGDYAKAIDLYEQIIANPGYSEEVVDQAASTLPTLYLDWGNNLADNGDYETAIEKFKDLIGKSPGHDMLSQAKSNIQQTYLKWGDSLITNEEYAEAIEKYELTGNYGSNDAEKQGLESAANAYLAWANALLTDESIAEAAEKYGVLSTTYSDTEAASQIPPDAFEPLVMYGQEVLDDEDFVAAGNTFELALSLGAEGQAELKAKAYTNWGQALNGQEFFIEALSMFQEARNLSDGSGLAATIDEAEQDSIIGVSELTNINGQLIMYAFLEDIIASETQSRIDINTSERCFSFISGTECISSTILELVYSAVGIDAQEARFLLYQEGEGRQSLPDNIEAEKPGHFRYAAYLVSQTITINSCPYYCKSTWPRPCAHVLRNQHQYIVTIIDTRTNEVIGTAEFLGSQPPGCPDPKDVHSASSSVYGSTPSMDLIYSWFEKLVK